MDEVSAAINRPQQALGDRPVTTNHLCTMLQEQWRGESEALTDDSRPGRLVGPESRAAHTLRRR